MFWSSETGIGLSDEYLWSGEGHDEIDEDELAYLTTCRQLAGDPDHFGRHTLPDLDQIPVGPFPGCGGVHSGCHPNERS
jgi:hypothetical protein